MIMTAVWVFVGLTVWAGLGYWAQERAEQRNG